MSEEKSKIPKGCVIGLAVAGGILLLIMIALGVVYYYRDDIRDSVLDMVEERIVQAEPDGYTETEIHRIFELYMMAIDSGDVGAKEGDEEAARAYTVFQEIFADNKVTKEEALRMLAAMRAITDDMDDSSLPPLNTETDSAGVDGETE